MTRTVRVVGLFCLMTCAGLLSGCGTVVKTGNVGLVINHFSGKVEGKIRHAGFNPLPPASGYEMLEIPTHKRTYTMVREGGEGAHGGDDSVRVNTLTGNVLNVDTSVTYHLAYDPARESEITALYSKYRSQFQGNGFSAFEEVQLRPVFRKAVGDAFGRMSTVEAMTGDGKLKAAKSALQELNTRLNSDSIVIDEVRIRAIWPDENTKNTLRTHLVAEQNLTLSTLNQKLAQINNERAISKADADAKAARIRASALTPRLVRFKHLDDINIVGVPPGAIVNAGAAPIAAPVASTAAPDPAPAAPASEQASP